MVAAQVSTLDEAPCAPAERRGLLTTLQAGRAIAAIAVVFSHLGISTEAFTHGVPTWLLAITGRGYLGVDFFFVLSGFIIYYSNVGDVRPGWPQKYAESRLLRIYVPYLPIGIGIAALYTLTTLSQGDRDWGWLTTLTLAPTGDHPALSVAWTLRHEVLFYAIAFVALLYRGPLVAMAIWAGAIGLNHLLGGGMGTPTAGLRRILLDPINLEFGFGVLAAWGFRRPGWAKPALFVLAGAAAIAFFFWIGGPRPLSVLFGLGLACLLVPIVQAEWNGRLAAGPWLLLLGNASYAIYLVHDPLLSLTSRLAARLPAAHWSLSFALGLAAAIAGGLAYHLLFERPALRWLKQLLHLRPTAGRPSQST